MANLGKGEASQVRLLFLISISSHLTAGPTFRLSHLQVYVIFFENQGLGARPLLFSAFLFYSLLVLLLSSSFLLLISSCFFLPSICFFNFFLKFKFTLLSSFSFIFLSSYFLLPFFLLSPSSTFFLFASFFLLLS